MIRLIAIILTLSASIAWGHGFDRETWNEKREDLVYEKNPEIEEPETKQESRQEQVASESRGSGNFVIPNVVLYSIVGALLIGLIILLVRQFSSNMSDEKLTKTVVINDDLDLNEVQKSELELSLEEALANQDYRLAVRIQFLIGLKSMYENNIILWKKRKTNYTYANEIQSVPLKNAFLRTIQVFEIAWYGKDALTELEYQNSQPYFDSFQETIQRQINNG